MAEKKIKNRTFRVDKLPATISVSLLFRLGRIIGPALGPLSTLKQPSTSGDDANKRERVLTVVGELFGELDPEKANELLIELCGHAQVKLPSGVYDPVVFDAVFTDDVTDAFHVALFVVEVNFGDFLNAA